MRQGAGEAPMDDLDSYSAAELNLLLERLRDEHRDLDAAISALESMQPGDQIKISRLKKRKLKLRDQISGIEDRQLPDIIA